MLQSICIFRILLIKTHVECTKHRNLSITSIRIAFVGKKERKTCNLFFFKFRLQKKNYFMHKFIFQPTTHVHVFIYSCLCVCVCLSVCQKASRNFNRLWRFGRHTRLWPFSNSIYHLANVSMVKMIHAANNNATIITFVHLSKKLFHISTHRVCCLWHCARSARRTRDNAQKICCAPISWCNRWTTWWCAALSTW